jgi:endonuclease/exonuclease/phosphatase family metal-dependent hydrolase
MTGKYIVGGDFNIEGGSADYSEATKLFGRESINAPDFAPTYTTR